MQFIRCPRGQEVSASKLLDCLLAKHSNDLCVPECKDGATWTRAESFRMDLWVLRRSYTKPCTTAYEIKVTRAYLPTCNQLYFVAPPGIIKPEEVPEEAGLFVSSKNMTRLYQKKKAPHRAVDDPVAVFKYILFSRATMGDEEDRKETTYNERFWRKWLARKDEKKELGWDVSKKIRELVTERIDKVDVENHRLQKENEHLADCKKILCDLKVIDEQGRGLSSWGLENKVKECVQRAIHGVDEKLIDQADACAKKLTDLVAALNAAITEGDDSAKG